MDTDEDYKRMRYEDRMSRKACMHTHPNDPDYDGPELIICDECGMPLEAEEYKNTWARFNGGVLAEKADYDNFNYTSICFGCASIGYCVNCGEFMDKNELLEGNCPSCQ